MCKVSVKKKKKIDVNRSDDFKQMIILTNGEKNRKTRNKRRKRLLKSAPTETRSCVSNVGELHVFTLLSYGPAKFECICLRSIGYVQRCLRFALRRTYEWNGKFRVR